ncbi:hypothetical protein BC831DRAFT_451938, partial [Entophlyctis helioformis]
MSRMLRLASATATMLRMSASSASSSNSVATLRYCASAGYPAAATRAATQAVVPSLHQHARFFKAVRGSQKKKPTNRNVRFQDPRDDVDEDADEDADDIELRSQSEDLPKWKRKIAHKIEKKDRKKELKETFSAADFETEEGRWKQPQFNPSDISKQSYARDDLEYTMSATGLVRKLQFRLADEVHGRASSVRNVEKVWYLLQMYLKEPAPESSDVRTLRKALHMLGSAKPAAVMADRLEFLLSVLRKRFAMAKEADAAAGDEANARNRVHDGDSQLQFTYDDLDRFLPIIGETATSVDDIKTFYGMVLFRCGLYQSKSNVGRLLGMLADRPNSNLAEQLFATISSDPDKHLRRTLHMYEVMAKYYCERGNIKALYEMLLDMDESSKDINELIFRHMLVCARDIKQPTSEQINMVKHTVKLMEKHNVEMTHWLCEPLLSIYFAKKECKEENEAIRKIAYSDVISTTRWWQSALVGYALADKPSAMRSVYDRAVNKNALVNSTMYCAVIDCFVRNQDPSAACHFHGQLRLDNVHCFEKTYTGLIKAVTPINLRLAMSFKRMVVRRFSRIGAEAMQYLIQGLLQAGYFQTARNELRDMWFCRTKPNTDIYHLFISAYLEPKQLDIAKALMYFKEMHRMGIRIKPKTIQLFADSIFQRESIADVKTVMQAIEAIKLPPSTIMYNCLIRLSARQGDLERVQQVLDEMKLKQVPIDEDTLAFVMEAHMLHDSPDKALQFWNEYWDNQMVPTSVAVSMLMEHVLATNDSGLWAQEWPRILKSGARLDSVASNQLIEVLVHFGRESDIPKALNLYFDVFEAKPNLDTFHHLRDHLLDQANNVDIWNSVLTFWAAHDERFARHLLLNKFSLDDLPPAEQHQIAIASQPVIESL